ncbi:MAG: C-GCAxxG-C-C family protein [Candidatus Cloacimonetes bacterium]|nr:C-GCAxxG-C-C family protein [Candidatus Cloacimonadota bacterium]
MAGLDLAQKAYDIAHATYLGSGSCSQCVLLGVQGAIGIVTDEQIKAAHTLSGGCSKMGYGICGALSGSLIALGANSGRDRDKIEKGKFAECYIAGRELIGRFRAEYGGFSCHDFHKKCHGRTFDMWDEAEMAELKSVEFMNACADQTGKVASWCVQTLLDTK